MVLAYLIGPLTPSQQVKRVPLFVAMIFTGLSIQIARFHSRGGGGGGGSYLCDKVQELWLKMGGGLIHEGGHIRGTLYGTFTTFAFLCL